MPSRRVLFAAAVVADLGGATLTLVLVDRLLRFDSQGGRDGVTLFAAIVTTAATVVLAWFAAVQVWDARRQLRGRRHSFT